MASYTVHPQWNSEDADFTIVIVTSIKYKHRTEITRTGFKVHRASLVKASPVFEDMFQFGTPEKGGEEANETDSIELDAPNKALWPILLAAAYNDFERFDAASLSALPYDSLLGLWQASHKYHLVALHRMCDILLPQHLNKATMQLSTIADLYKCAQIIGNDPISQTCWRHMLAYKKDNLWEKEYAISGRGLDGADVQRLHDHWNQQDRREKKDSLTAIMAKHKSSMTSELSGDLETLLGLMKGW